MLSILNKLINRDPRDISGISKPKYIAQYHHFSPRAIQEGRDKFQETMQLNKDFPDQGIAMQYASDIEELIKYTVMYLDSGQIKELDEVKRMAFYWVAWVHEYMKRSEDFANEHGLIVTGTKDE